MSKIPKLDKKKLREVEEPKENKLRFGVEGKSRKILKVPFGKLQQSGR